ncbi:lactadherin-like, partial [Dendronephthya gigantea]|uniref:lactadherin-like n=1 Tax=Dendronephthya gigantea TaxID=151771 RepID=UPI001069D730
FQKYNLSCLDPKACNMALGMENGNINDSQITASSEHKSKSLWAVFGRLNFTPGNGKEGEAWSSKNNDLNQWLQVDFQRSTLVTGISTQGRINHNQFVKNYKVSFSQNGYNFEDYIRKGAVKVFKGNTDRNSIVHNTVIPRISARFIRIHPTAWNKHISMRVEFYGCSAT